MRKLTPIIAVAALALGLCGAADAWAHHAQKGHHRHHHSKHSATQSEQSPAPARPTTQKMRPGGGSDSK